MNKVVKNIFVVFAVLVITASVASGLAFSLGNANVDAGVNSGEIVATGDGQPPTTPFMISGYINDSTGEPVINPNVTVTNLNTTGVFIVKTNVSSNYYQVVTSSGNVSAGNTLMTNVTDGTSYNGTGHTVAENEMNATGGFTQNITLMRGATYGDVVINEIMYDPAGKDSLYEWVELYNNDSTEIDVRDWVLNGTIGGSDTILSGTMGAGTYLLIAKNMTAFEERYNVSCPKIAGNWSALANPGDWVNLSNATGSNIDSVYYPGDFTANYSAERNATGGWEKSLIDGGTPCEENSVTQAGVALPCTCGDICANTTGWWRAGAAFNASNTPIQHAINNATAGKMICVKDGTYNENVNVNKRLTIRSENGSVNCIVNASDSTDYVFTVTADYVNITGFTVENATGSGVAGIYLHDADNCHVRENNVTDNANGIQVNTSSDNVIADNIVHHNSRFGVWVHNESNDNRVENNTVYNQTGYWNSLGIGIFDNCQHNHVYNNTVHDNTIDNIELWWDACYNTIEKNRCYHSEYGILMTNTTDHNLIINNELYENDYGIGMGVINESWGSQLLINTSVCDNQIRDNTKDGIFLDRTDNNSIYDNNCSSNGQRGIYLNCSSNNNFTNNTASGNTDYDFYSHEDARNNTVENLTIASYPTTISFTYDNGIGIKGVTTPPEPDPAGKINISKYVNATNVTADSWIFLNVSYEDADLGNVDETTLKMWKHNGTDWIEVPQPNGVNTVEKYVYANITEFCIFAPLGNPSAELPCTCGDICVNTTGWWHADAAFNTSNTPIQHAINNATAGETICVKDGTYNENVDVDKRLTIQSENGSADCIVNAPDSSDYVFNITANYVNISGFSVQNATGGGEAGIYLSNADHCNISKNNASNNRYGIYLSSSSNNTLTNNTANYNSYYGIHVYDSCNNNLTNNTANNNTGERDSKGIVLEESAHNNLTRNVANNNSEIGFWLYNDSHHNSLTNNTATLNEVGFWLEDNAHNNTLTNNTANSNGESGIRLDESNDNEISDNICENNGGEESGIHLESSHGNAISGNTCNDNDGDGIYLNDSHFNGISGNFANGNAGCGILLNFSNVNTITGNEVFDNWGWEGGGIYLVSSDNNVLTGNNVAGNGVGIHLDPSNYNTIADNDVNDNGWHGIWLQDSSDHNEVTGNTVLGNGIECGHGIYVQSSSYNDIVGNNASETWEENGICVEGWGEGPTSYNNVTDNAATNNGGDGIALMGEDNCTIVNNTASDNDGNGIKLEFSFDNNVTDNICNDNGGDIRAGFMPAPIPPQGHGITMSNSNNNIVSRNEANGNFGTGINQESSSYNDITDNTASENGAEGISVSAEGPLFSYNNVTNNTATNNGGAGIALMGEDNCTIVNNTASDNDGNGICLWESTDNEIFDNVANNNGECGIRLELSCSNNNLTNNTANDNDWDGISIVDFSNENTIFNNSVSYNADGIWIENSTHNTVENNNVRYNPSGDSGIHLENANYTTIAGNNVTDNDDGICLFSSFHNNVTNNNVSNNSYDGIGLYSSSNNIIANNTASNNEGSGIYSEDSINNNISNNNVSNNVCYGICLYSSTDNNITNNTANNNTGEEGSKGIVLEKSSNNTLTHNVANNNNETGIWLYNNSYNNTLINNTAKSNQIGIWLESNSYNNSLTNNTANDNAGNGIYLDASSNNTVTNNNASNNDYGIRLEDSSYNTITNNSAYNNSGDGIGLDSSNNNNVTNNNVSNNSYDGIYLELSCDNEISYNTVSDNEYHGIHLYNNSADNEISDNIANNNSDGSGIRLGLSCSNNNVTNNTANDNSGDGISIIDFSNENTIVNNSVSDNADGIWIENSTHNKIENNNVSHNPSGNSGIHLENANYTTIAGNNVTDNDDGIYLNSSLYNNITNNNVSNNDYGIVLNLSSNNTLTNNTASNSTAYGFWSDEGSHNNTVKNLTISSYPTTISFTYDNGVGLKGVETAPPDPAGKANISKFVNATNVTVDSWIFLNVSYEKGDLGGVDEDSLRMWRHNGTDWTEDPEPNGVNTVENYVYANVTEFSVFAPLGNVSPINITITSPENTTYASTCVRLNFTVEPEGTALAWIGYSLDGGANVTIAGNTTVPVGAPPYDHNIVVYANDTHGNMTASNIVYFTIHPGDINNDNVVNVLDLSALSDAAFAEPGDPYWNPDADLNGDNIINVLDLAILSDNAFNEY